MNTAAETIEIRLSKRKLILMLAGSIAFVAGGIWFQFLAQNPPTHGPALLREPLVLRLVGISGILLFGFFAISIFRKLFDKAPGLLISGSGITDNCSALSVGEIPWTDILEIRPIELRNQKLLMILVKNPEEYIERQPNIIKRKIAQMNYSGYGSPISITAGGMQCSFEELYILLMEKFKEAKNPQL